MKIAVTLFRKNTGGSLRKVNLSAAGNIYIYYSLFYLLFVPCIHSNYI
jgi:hypothetical protein